MNTFTLTIGAGQNPARQAAMSAGVPKEVPSTSINMLCGSGLRAVALGYQAIKCGEARFVVAGGQESMSQVSSLHVLYLKDKFPYSYLSPKVSNNQLLLGIMGLVLRQFFSL